MGGGGGGAFALGSTQCVKLQIYRIAYHITPRQLVVWIFVRIWSGYLSEKVPKGILTLCSFKSIFSFKIVNDINSCQFYSQRPLWCFNF